MAAENRHAIRDGQLAWALAGLVFLCVSAAVGFNLKTRLLKPGTTETVIDFVTVLTGFLATTAAIVMGLLINSAKTFVDAARDHWATYAGQLLRLDQCMRNYGTESEPIRAQLQSFTAAGIANFWRHESAPTGLTYPDVRNMSADEVSLTLNELLNNVKLGILRLQPPIHCTKSSPPTASSNTKVRRHPMVVAARSPAPNACRILQGAHVLADDHFRVFRHSSA